MIPKKQTRVHKGMEPVTDRGNCFPACIASLLEMEVEDVIQIQEYYDNENWKLELHKWLNDRGYVWRELTEEDNILDRYLLGIGVSPRNTDLSHVVIFKNGEIVHDPHPDNTGLVDSYAHYFEIIEKA